MRRLRIVSHSSNPAKQHSQHIRLHSIHGIKGLIQKQTHRATEVDPRRAIPVQRGIIIQHSQEIDDHKREAGKRNLFPNVNIAPN